MNDLYKSDKPSIDPQSDSLNRYPFARRIAQTLARRSDPSSIVVAIHGKWGEGKTTVLDFIYNELRSEDVLKTVIPVRFNPWRFHDESELLASFFGTIAAALNRSSKSKTTKVAEELLKYGAILNSFNFELPGVKLSAREAVEVVAKQLAETSLDDQKNRIERLLQQERQRIIVFLDDIDRLDTQEIRAIVRLLKLTANFDYVDYIVAFDRDIVAAAIGEQYGSDGKQSGFDYLQKVVQVNLDLPLADRPTLGRICINGIIEGLQIAEIHLTDDQREEYQKAFEQVVLPALRHSTDCQTIRKCCRFHSAADQG